MDRGSSAATVNPSKRPERPGVGAGKRQLLSDRGVERYSGGQLAVDTQPLYGNQSVIDGLWQKAELEAAQKAELEAKNIIAAQIAKEVAKLYLNSLLAEARRLGKSKIIIPTDSDGTLFLHTWLKDQGYCDDNYKFSNLNFFGHFLDAIREHEKADQAKSEGEKISVQAIIVSNQWGTQKKADEKRGAENNPASLEYTYGGVVPFIGREFTHNMGGDKTFGSKGAALKAVLDIDPSQEQSIMLVPIDDEQNESYRMAFSRASIVELYGLSSTHEDLVQKGIAPKEAKEVIEGACLKPWDAEQKNPKSFAAMLQAVQGGASFGFCPNSALLHIIKTGHGRMISQDLIERMGCKNLKELGAKTAAAMGVSAPSAELFKVADVVAPAVAAIGVSDKKTGPVRRLAARVVVKSSEEKTAAADNDLASLRVRGTSITRKPSTAAAHGGFTRRPSQKLAQKPLVADPNEAMANFRAQVREILAKYDEGLEAIKSAKSKTFFGKLRGKLGGKNSADLANKESLQTKLIWDCVKLAQNELYDPESFFRTASYAGGYFREDAFGEVSKRLESRDKDILNKAIRDTIEKRKEDAKSLANSKAQQGASAAAPRTQSDAEKKLLLLLKELTENPVKLKSATDDIIEVYDDIRDKGVIVHNKKIDSISYSESTGFRFVSEGVTVAPSDKDVKEVFDRLSDIKEAAEISDDASLYDSSEDEDNKEVFAASDDEDQEIEEDLPSVTKQSKVSSIKDALLSNNLLDVFKRHETENSIYRQVDIPSLEAKTADGKPSLRRGLIIRYDKKTHDLSCISADEGLGAKGQFQNGTLVTYTPLENSEYLDEIVSKVHAPAKAARPSSTSSLQSSERSH